MRESEKLLKNSNVPVSKVALLSGYQEPSYFMKVFKKILWMYSQPVPGQPEINKNTYLRDFPIPLVCVFYLTFSFHVLNYSLHTL